MSRKEMELLFSVSHVNAIDGWKLFNTEINGIIFDKTHLVIYLSFATNKMF